MLDWLRENVWFVFSILSGAVLSVITIDTKTVKEAFIRASAGIFCSLVFTDAFLDIMDLDTTVYRNSVAGLFALAGYGVSKTFANISFEKILLTIKALRGVK